MSLKEKSYLLLQPMVLKLFFGYLGNFSSYIIRVCQFVELQLLIAFSIPPGNTMEKKRFAFEKLCSREMFCFSFMFF